MITLHNWPYFKYLYLCSFYTPSSNPDIMHVEVDYLLNTKFYTGLPGLFPKFYITTRAF